MNHNKTMKKLEQAQTIISSITDTNDKLKNAMEINIMNRLITITLTIRDIIRDLEKGN